MINTKTIVEIDGRSYVADIGRVSDQWLGIEDHGMFTLNIEFCLGGSSYQGTGHYILGTASKSSESYGKVKGYPILQLLEVFGVSEWSEIQNKMMYVLYDEGAYHGQIRGLASLEGNRHLLLDNLGK